MGKNKAIAVSSLKPDSPGDDNDWLRRCEYWARAKASGQPSRAKRERPREPLILSGHGISLRIENGALAIREGLTHYPQKPKAHRFVRRRMI